MERAITIDGELVNGENERRVMGVKEEQLSGEVMTPDALSKFPDLSDLNNRDLIVMMAVAHNFSYRAIHDATSIPVTTIHDIVKRIDPCGRYRLDDDGMKAFLAKRARGKAAETLAVMDIEKIRDCTPVQQAKMVKTLTETAAISERKDLGSLGGKGIKKVTVEFVDEIDEAKPVAEYIEESAY